MESNNKILPPANGKKLWRVKLANAGSRKAIGSSFSMECFNNSMKISAAGSSYLTRRPPSKRPKNKPGMPKDFVFVDLLPVKSQEAEMSGTNELASISSAPSSASNSTHGSLPASPSSDDDSIFSTLDSAAMMAELDQSLMYVQDTHLADSQPEMGLGLLNIDFGVSWQTREAAPSASELAPLAYPIQHAASTPQIGNEFDTTQRAPMNQPHGHKRAYTVAEIPTGGAPSLKRSRSAGDRRRSGEIQFKPYHAPVAGPRKQLGHRHTVSAPVVPQIKNQQSAVSNLEDFMLLNEQISVFLSDSETSETNSDYSPTMEFVPEVDNPKHPQTLKGCADQFLVPKPEDFDFNSFVTF